MTYKDDLQNESEIFGGEDLSSNKKINTSVVALLTTGSSAMQVCTGTFISSDIILTAAHCVSGDKADTTVHLSNSIFENDIDIQFDLIKIKIHPDYEKGKHDLALIQIINHQGILIKPISLIDERISLQNKDFVLFGYGVNQLSDPTDEELTEAGSGALRKVSVPSQYVFEKNGKIIFNQSNGFGVCHGDSGGPAFILGPKNKYILAGVASGVVQSENQKDCSHESEYTKVSPYKNWILQTISDFNGD